MTKIEEFRKKDFRNTIKTIAEQRGADFKYRDMKWFLGKDGVTRSVRVNKSKAIEDVIAGFWMNDGSVEVITFGDYQAFLRDTKLAEVFGEEVPVVKDFQKKVNKVEPEPLEVGKIYLMGAGGRCTSTSVIRIKKTTRTTATFEYISYTLPQHLQDKKEASYEYYIECDLSDLVLGEAFGEHKVRCSASGSWRTSPGYGASYIKTEDRRFIDEYYFD